MHEFVFNALPIRVVFGAGTVVGLGDEVARLGARRALICCTPGATARLGPLTDALGAACAGVFNKAAPHCPRTVADAALEEFQRRECDCVIPFGGGSTIGLGKWITVATGAPMLAVPTTYSGSEMTPLYGVLMDGEKRTWRKDAALATAVLYDPVLTTGLPARLTATTGMNSLAHCVEALYAEHPNPIATLLATAGIRAHATGLAGSVAAPADLAARTEALYGGCLGGAVVTLVGIAIHHKVCHVLGGRTGLPHGETNAVILPHAIASNAAAAPTAMATIRAALGAADCPAEDAAAAVYDLAAALGAPTSLAALGLAAADLDAVARATLTAVSWNPRPVDFASVRAMLADAHAGRRPRELPH